MEQFYPGPRFARRFTDIVSAKIPGYERKFRDDKIAARAIAEACGVRVPTMFGTYAGPEALPLASLPDRVVVKATRLASKRSVHLLRRIGPDQYSDLLTGEDFTERQIKDRMIEALLSKGRPLDTTVLAEELIVGENGADQIPFDYKFYTFDGEAELIVQIDRNVTPASIAFFTRGFVPLEPHRLTLSRKVQAGRHIRPANWQEMLETARRISVHMNEPFVSIDTYTDGRETVLGELTPRPGGPFYGMWYFSTELDTELGTYYRLALRRRGMPHDFIIEGLAPGMQRRRDKQQKTEQNRVRELARVEAERMTPQQSKPARQSRPRPPGVRQSASLLLNAIRRFVRRRLPQTARSEQSPHQSSRTSPRSSPQSRPDTAPR